jgi:hypothetical protein
MPHRPRTPQFCLTQSGEGIIRLAMPIIETVEQLAEFLEQNEEWRRRIYSILVPRELARLPAEFDEFRAEVRREFDSVRTEMREGFARVDQEIARVDRKIEDVRTEMREGFARVDQEIENVRTEMRGGYERLERKIQKNTGDIAELKGISLEQQYRNRARALFGKYIRNLTVIDWTDLEEQLEAVAPLTEKEREELSIVDLLARGRRKADGQELVLVIEISWTLAQSDVERAVRRAEILTRRGIAAVAAVAGREIDDETREAAQTAGCAVVMDGRFEGDQPLRGA